MKQKIQKILFQVKLESKLNFELKVRLFQIQPLPKKITIELKLLI